MKHLWIKRSPVLDDLEFNSVGKGTLFGAGGSQPAGSTTTTQNAEPWNPQQPYLKEGMGAAQDLYQNYTPSYFSGDTFAGMDPAQNAAYGNTINYAASGGIAPDALNASTNFLSGNAAQNNPALDKLSSIIQPGYIANGKGFQAGMNTQIDQATNGFNNNPAFDALNQFASGGMGGDNPYFQNMSQNVLAQVVPGLEAQFNKGNNMGSPGAAYAVSKGATDALGNLAYQNYGDSANRALTAANSMGNMFLSGAGLQQSAGQNLMTDRLNQVNTQIGAANSLGQNYESGQNDILKAMSLAPTVNQMPLQNYAAMADAGSQYQAQNQKAINDAISKFNFNQNLPYDQLSRYMSTIQGNYGGTTSTSQPYFQNTGMNLLSGALGGGFLGSMLGGQTGGMGGAGIGALLSLL